MLMISQKSKACVVKSFAFIKILTRMCEAILTIVVSKQIHEQLIKLQTVWEESRKVTWYAVG